MTQLKLSSMPGSTREATQYTPGLQNTDRYAEGPTSILGLASLLLGILQGP